MIKNSFKRVVALLLSIGCILTNVSALGVSAEEDNNNISNVVILNEEDNGQPPVVDNEFSIVPYGSSKPSSNNVWKLSQGPYNASISQFYHLIYTNYCFVVPKDGSRIHATISGDQILEYIDFCRGEGHTEFNFTFTLYEYKGALSGFKEIDSYEIVRPVPTSNVLGHVFTGLKKDTKYCISVEKTVDGITFTNLNLSVKLI